MEAFDSAQRLARVFYPVVHTHHRREYLLREIPVRLAVSKRHQHTFAAFGDLHIINKVEGGIFQHHIASPNQAGDRVPVFGNPVHFQQGFARQTVFTQVFLQFKSTYQGVGLVLLQVTHRGAIARHTDFSQFRARLPAYLTQGVTKTVVNLEVLLFLGEFAQLLTILPVFLPVKVRDRTCYAMQRVLVRCGPDEVYQ